MPENDEFYSQGMEQNQPGQPAQQPYTRPQQPYTRPQQPYTRPQQPYRYNNNPQNYPPYGYQGGMPPYRYGYGAPYGYPPPPPPPKTTNGGKVALWSILGVLVVIASSIILFVATNDVSGGKNITDEPSGSSKYEASFDTPSDIAKAPKTKANEDGPQISAADTPELYSDSTKAASAAYQKASHSVVCIRSYTDGGDFTLDASGEGSGIILTADGYIVTNSHVVDDSKKTGTLITLYDNSQYLGTIIGVDVKTDLAVLKIDAEGLEPAEFADSDKLVVGQDVYAIGNPGGAAFSNSLTKGALSALNRVLSGSGYVKYIQTDAAINPGNSGGALINEYGQVIGINTAKLVAEEYEAMGFAIPSNKVLEIINKLIKYGYVNDRGTLSIEGKTCTLYMSKSKKIPQGMMLTKINSDSPLKSTQAQKDDIIIAVNDTTVKSAVEFIDEMSVYKPGDTVKLTLFRKSGDSGYTFDISVKLLPDTGKE